MRTVTILIVMLLLCLKSTAQPLPAIGLSTQPANSATICEPPYYTGSFYTSGYQVGDTVNDFKLYNLLGDSLVLSEELENGKPILLIAGSLTCPIFRSKVPVINQVMATYGSSISVFVIYTIEAHPTDTSVYSGNINTTSQNITANILFPNPLTYGQRKQMVDTLSDFVSLNAPVFIDGPCNEWWNAYGPAPNNSYLIDTNGVVISKHGWFHKLPNDNIFCDIDSYLSVISGSCTTANGPGSFGVQVINNVSYGSPQQTLYDFANVINTSSVPVTVCAQKIMQQMPTSWQSSFCADVCYSSFDDSVSFVVNPFDTLLFSLDFYTGPTMDTGKVRVGFRNTNNLSQGYAYWLKASTFPPTGLSEQTKMAEVLFFPNPFEKNLKILAPDSNFEVEVYNSLGQKVIQQKNSYEIDTNSWPAGIYTVHYLSKTRNISRKVILRH